MYDFVVVLWFASLFYVDYSTDQLCQSSMAFFFVLFLGWGLLTLFSHSWRGNFFLWVRAEEGGID